MLSPLGNEPDTSDFQVLHATACANSPISGSLSPLDPYVVDLMLCIIFIIANNLVKDIYLPVHLLKWCPGSHQMAPTMKYQYKMSEVHKLSLLQRTWQVNDT